jgi:hypothetical protein
LIELNKEEWAGFFGVRQAADWCLGALVAKKYPGLRQAGNIKIRNKELVD